MICVTSVNTIKAGRSCHWSTHADDRTLLYCDINVPSKTNCRVQGKRYSRGGSRIFLRKGCTPLRNYLTDGGWGGGDLPFPGPQCSPVCPLCPVKYLYLSNLIYQFYHLNSFQVVDLRANVTIDLTNSKIQGKPKKIDCVQTLLFGRVLSPESLPCGWFPQISCYSGEMCKLRGPSSNGHLYTEF